MKNIFIELKGKVKLKQEPLLKMLDIDPEEESIPKVIEEYFENEDQSPSHTAAFIMRLIKQFKEAVVKEKLYTLLVFFVSKVQPEEALKITEGVMVSEELTSTKARFFALLFKSSTSNDLKKKLVQNTVALIEKETKISIFSNFVQNFDSLISSLTFKHNEYVKLYLQLINILEKHIVYKKIVNHYIVHCLLHVSPDNAQSSEVDSLLLKLLRYSEVTDESVALLHHKALLKNQFYPYLSTLLLGDFEKYSKLDKKLLVGAGVSEAQFEKRVKIEAIPRVLSSNRQNVQIVSYDQISEILKIKKEEVESYIIEAIHNGIIKAKIDESSQSIIINSVKLRSLQGEERANLQRNISNLASRLEQIAS